MKRILSFVLAITMLFSVTAAIDLSAFADEGVVLAKDTLVDDETTETEEIPVSNVKAATGTTTIRISYDKVAGASGYEIQMKNAAGNWVHYVNTGYSDKEWTNFSPATKYEIRVRAYTIVDGKLNFSDAFSAPIKCYTKPLKLENLRTTWRSSNGDRIKLQWNAQPKADGYKIYQRVDGTWKEIVNVKGGAEAGYVIGGLTPDTKYEFVMRAYKGGEGNLGAWSAAEKTYTFPNTTALDKTAVQNVKVSTGVTTARISYDKVYGANGYEIQMKNAAGNWVHYVNTGYTSKEWNLSVSTKYEIRVRSYRIVDGKIIYSNAFSNSVKFYTKPSKLENLRTTWRSANGDRIKLQWNAQPKADGYKIYQKFNGDWWEIATVKGGAESGCVLEALTPDTKYEFAMRAYKGGEGNLGAWSAAEKTYTNVNVYDTNKFYVKDFKVSNIGATSMDMTWSSVNGAYGYELQIKEGNGEWSYFTTSIYNSLHYDVLYSATEYSIRVRPYIMLGSQYVYSERWSSEVHFYTKPRQVYGITGYYTDDPSVIAIDWWEVDGADGYKVYARESGTSQWFEIPFDTPLTEPECYIFGLQPGIEYEFAVRAYYHGTGNLGAFSDIIEYSY